MDTLRRLIGLLALSLAPWLWVLAAPPTPLALATSATPVTAAAPIVIGTEAAPDGYFSRFATLIYTEAFKRLGMSIRLDYLPLARQRVLLDSGAIDADGGRIYEFGATHPNLVRVEESHTDLNFALYATKPGLRLQSLEQLRSNELLVEYRRGILFCEKALTPMLTPARLSTISSEEQGVQKLLLGRTDLYCDLDMAVRRVSNLPEFKDRPQVYKAFAFGAIPIHMYLHGKHAELAPRLAIVIKQMKAEGLIDVYRRQVERDLGWTR